MAERIFLISDKDDDLEIIKKTLGPEGYEIYVSSAPCDIEDVVSDVGFAAILADYDFAGEKIACWVGLLQEKKSRLCLILYGEKSSPESVAELLRKGVYGFIPRYLLADRVCDMLKDGLENRKAFVEILTMMDKMKEINENLGREKAALKKRNRELDFINRLSREVSYDLNWDRVLGGMIEAGLTEIIDVEAVSVLYRLGSAWNFACVLPDGQNNRAREERLRKEAADKFFILCGKKSPAEEISSSLQPSSDKFCPCAPVFLPDRVILPLSPGGQIKGVLLLYQKNNKAFDNGNREIMSTISNILTMSLDNAEKYQKVKKLTMRDGLTGAYNRTGFREFIEKEFLKGVRYNKPLSLIMIDLNDFKNINDSFGHPAGDHVLKEFASCLKKNLRQTDILARYGGDEFAVILPETDLKMAEILAKRAISFVRSNDFEWKSKKIAVEFSYGISSMDELGSDGGTAELISIADSRMYRKKRAPNLNVISYEGRYQFSAAV